MTVQLRPGARHKKLPSIVRIISSEWLSWLKHRPARTGLKTFSNFKIVSPSKIKIFRTNSSSAHVERQHGIRLECG
jgi:hypothetical protein